MYYGWIEVMNLNICNIKGINAVLVHIYKYMRYGPVKNAYKIISAKKITQKEIFCMQNIQKCAQTFAC